MFKLPTVFQDVPGSAYLFYEEGVMSMDPLRIPGGIPYSRLKSQADKVGRIWALVDTGRELYEPDAIFQENSPFFVIEASSTRAGRYDWAKKVKHQLYYMKPWSFVETLQVYVNLQLTRVSQHSCLCSRSLINPKMSERDLLYLHSPRGSSLRMLTNFFDNPDGYKASVDREVAKISYDDLWSLFKNPIDRSEASHFLVSTGPSESDRTKHSRWPTSDYAVEAICRDVFKNKADKIRELYDMVRGEPEMNATSGMFFEHQVHQLLRKGRTFDLYQIKYRKRGKANHHFDDYTATDSKTPTIQLTVPASDGKFNSRTAPHGCTGAKYDAYFRPDVNVYYRPKESNFPTIDSWIHTAANHRNSSTLFAFQITLNQTKHDLKEIGLDFIDKTMAKGIEKALIIVTEGEQPKIDVPNTYLDAKLVGGSGAVDEIFPVYHLPLTREELFG
jgi:hypothetical protein